MQEKRDVDLMSQMIPKIHEDFKLGKRESVFSSLSQRIKNGDICDETMLPFIEQLQKDIVLFKDNQPVSECAFFIPRRGNLNKVKLDVYIQMLHPDDDKVKSIIRYQKSVSLLNKAFIDQEFNVYKCKFNKKPDFWTNHSESSIPKMVSRPFAPEIRNPTAMPIEHTPAEELIPILDYLKGNKIPDTGYDQLNWCTVYSDGRFDACKQGVGKTTKQITESLANNEKITHFLYGNNIMGTEGCEAISDLLTNEDSIPKIKTWYLAGNNINHEGMKKLRKALAKNKDVEDLWLKRNPLGVLGVKVVAQIMEENTSIVTLDLDNTGMMNEGLKSLMDSLAGNCTLRNLYIDSNGITSSSALISYFIQLINEKDEDFRGIDSLWLGINRLTDSEAIPLIYTIGKYKHMKRLYLGSNMLTSESARACYYAFRNHKNLEVLDLGKYKSTDDMGEISNILRDEGAFWIAKLIRENTSLKYVNLSGNYITEVGASYLKDSINNQSKEYFEQLLIKKQDPEYRLGKIVSENGGERRYELFRHDKKFGEFHQLLDKDGIVVSSFCSSYETNDKKMIEYGFFDRSDLPEHQLMFLYIDNVDKELEEILMKRRAKHGITSDDIRFIKHGNTINNIDSIYRNAAMNDSKTSSDNVKSVKSVNDDKLKTYMNYDFHGLKNYHPNDLAFLDASDYGKKDVKELSLVLTNDHGIRDRMQVWLKSNSEKSRSYTVFYNPKVFGNFKLFSQGMGFGSDLKHLRYGHLILVKSDDDTFNDHIVKSINVFFPSLISSGFKISTIDSIDEIISDESSK